MTLVDKEKILTVYFDGIPKELKKFDQWVLWKAELKPGKEPVYAKVPYQANGVNEAKSNDKSTWGTFKAISEAYLADKGDGVGFILTEEDSDGLRIFSTIFE